MKKTVVLALALAIGLSACAKRKPAAPGQSGLPGGEMKQAEVPNSDPRSANKLVGTWEAPCEEREYRVDVDKVRQIFHSARRVVIIDNNGKMEEHFYHFKGSECATYDTAAEQEPDLYTYKIVEAGEANGKPYALEIAYIDNGEETGPTASNVTYSADDSRETIQFQGSSLVYTLRQ